MKLDKKSTMYLVILIAAMSIPMGVFAESSLANGDQMVTVSSKQPLWDQDKTFLLMERSAPADVRVGQLFEQTIKITNASKQKMTFRDIEVIHYLAENFDLDSATPKPGSTGDGRVKWFFDKLAPGESKLITIKGAAKRAGPVMGCAAATYKIPVCLTINAIQPELMLTKTGPSEVLLCEPIEFVMVVSNPGIGKADNVKIVDTLPAGLTTKDGKSTVEFKVGSLDSGESRELRLSVKAKDSGTYVNSARASADPGLAAQASHRIVIRRPSLVIDKSGPRNRIIGRNATYEITVSNKGDGRAQDTTLVDHVPSGASVVKASDGGKVSGGRVTWNLGNLAVGASKTVSLTLKMPNKKATVRNVVRATAICSKDAQAEAVTQVAGIPAILLEVKDTEDPIEIGANETYEIVVTNQGSAAATNIVIVCTIAKEMSYVSADGETTAKIAGNKVVFGALPSLPPKAKAIYHVVAKAVRTGDTRFTVTLTSDQLTSPPVEETESTHLY